MARKSVARSDCHQSSLLLLIPTVDVGEGFTNMVGGNPEASSIRPHSDGGARGQQPTMQLGKKKIGIVDDETSLCSAYAMVVKSLGYETEFVAHDGDEAVKSVLNGGAKPDLIIMDYRMPGMDGLEAAKRILKEKPQTMVVIASADDSVEAVVTASGLYYLHKPFSVVELKNLMKALLPP